jgi:hypothetical protein
MFVYKNCTGKERAALLALSQELPEYWNERVSEDCDLVTYLDVACATMATGSAAKRLCKLITTGTLRTLV